MTNKNCSFEEWYDLLMDIASDYGCDSLDVNKWMGIYEAGKTPVDAWLDEWGNN
ncbi:hypothetical protein [Proteus terrae]|uniref:hypothetical protein n=1 Tax=Proteus terrae TaxID=1574161 RepID=UPI0013E05BBD|nr:hypothetical protein [Proteus terrae]